MGFDLGSRITSRSRLPPLPATSHQTACTQLNIHNNRRVFVCVCVRACVRARVYACVRACVHVVCFASVYVCVLRACEHACLWVGWVGCRGMGICGCRGICEYVRVCVVLCVSAVRVCTYVCIIYHFDLYSFIIGASSIL